VQTLNIKFQRLVLTRNLSTRALWQPPVLPGGPASRDISRASRIMGEINKNLVYPSPWDYKRSLTCVKSPALFPIRRKLCCGFLSSLKIHRLGRVQTRDLWEVGGRVDNISKRIPVRHVLQVIQMCCGSDTARLRYCYSTVLPLNEIPHRSYLEKETAPQYINSYVYKPLTHG
jgi:hypothetical protein